jgi:hypothetical protein
MLPVALAALKEAQHWVMPLRQHTDSHRLRPPATNNISLRSATAAAAAATAAAAAVAAVRPAATALAVSVGATGAAAAAGFRLLRLQWLVCVDAAGCVAEEAECKRTR